MYNAAQFCVIAELLLQVLCVHVMLIPCLRVSIICMYLWYAVALRWRGKLSRDREQYNVLWSVQSLRKN